MSPEQQKTNIQPYERLAAYYDQLMEYIDYEIWVDDILHALEPFNLGQNWLDISCGTGSMAILLAQQGIQMSAVDISPHMLEIARQKAEAAEVDIQLAVGDMTSFRNGQTYDAVLNLHDGLNYLLDESRVDEFLKNARSLLSPDGVLLFDVVTPLLCQTHFRGYREIFSDEKGGYERYTSYDPESQLAESTFTLETEDEDRVDLESHIQRAYTLEEVETFCKRSPFSWYQILDDESLEAADESSERLWVMLRGNR